MKNYNAVLHITSKKPMAIAELSERVAISMTGEWSASRYHLCRDKNQ
ncbi:hypothetical protein [Microbacter margulisiae]|uniref:Uncharacterized protein n=1 Tax=Microbacter margulisiae TaxID=1350067 RepID=A0A7W5DN07_9PORP|nr:hypothetical protein [Microbacter margulisiae]MBB3185922.1 hypothetical protein [Microbacter margulisiae]